MSRFTHRAVLAAVVLVAAACSTDNTPTAAPSASRASAPGRALAAAEAGERVRVARAVVESARELRVVEAEYRAGRREIRAGSPLLVCRPERYEADVRVVGPEGGVLRVGRHTLTIPAGALREPTVITMEAPPSLAAEVRFAPHGLKFAAPAVLEIDHARCLAPAREGAGVAYVNDALDVLEWPASREGRGGRVEARIWHFSTYVASRRSGGYTPAW